VAARDGVNMSLPALGGDMVWSRRVVVVAVRGGVVMVTWCDGGGGGRREGGGEWKSPSVASKRETEVVVGG
jgi:hypothetical protein